MTSRLLLGSVALIAAVGCSGTDATPKASSSDVDIAQSQVARVPATSVPSADFEAAVTANNAFAFDLYAQALTQRADKNLLMSPISAELALTMTYAGAQGTTKSEMASALHFAADAGDSIFAGQNALSQALNERASLAYGTALQTFRQYHQGAEPSADDYQLQVVNSVWGEKTYAWEKPFLDTLSANYGTGVYQQDFVHDYEPARGTINGWVSTNTNHKINELIPSGALDEYTRMVLVNAIHLKLPWAKEFRGEATANADFTRGDGSIVSTSFMNDEGHYGYTDGPLAQLVSLPLSNGQLSVVIGLPHADVSLANYEASLATGGATFASPKSSEFVYVSLPKVAFTSPSVSLASALEAMGMKQAFVPDAADFTGLCAHPPDGRNLYVADVLQKAMIGMDETGVEAAAATAVVVAGNLSADPMPVPMVVNRPYLIAIVDEPTGAILMLGHIQDPSDAGQP